MREIEFRAKHTWNGSFVYGYLVCVPADNSYRITQGRETSYFIDPETVGQYTGLKDKNGTKIFEGDIIIGDIPELVGNQNLIGIVEYEESAFIVKFPNRQSWQIQKVGFCSFVNYRVIGNIYDNPELLED